MIDILIPVLGRPHNAQPLVDNIRDTTKVEHTITFLCSRGDDAQITACQQTDANTIVMDHPAGRGDYAQKINHGLNITRSEWLFMAADDVRFEPRWDYHATHAAKDKFHVVATNDLANTQVQKGMFGTHCLIRRRYVTDTGGTVTDGPGVVLHEGYDHNYVDRELCHTAQHRGVFVYARHSRVRHYHHLWRTAPYDATYRKGIAKSRDDQKLFIDRAHLWSYTGLSEHERKMAA